MSLRGQIFTQDISVSFVISLITILLLISFINYHNSDFAHNIRTEHKMAIIERISSKLFLENEYNFNEGSFVVSRQFLSFAESLNNEDVYEQFRERTGLNREGVSYEVEISVTCEDGVSKSGGRSGKDVLTKTILVYMDNVLCSVNIGVGER